MVIDKAQSTRSNLPTLAGWANLRQLSSGDPEIRVAILDGPVDLRHGCFRNTRLIPIDTLASSADKPGIALTHGTHIASVIFGRGEDLLNLAPECSGLIVPIFPGAADVTALSCPQIDLARAILQAVQHGAHIINISGGEPESTGEADPLLRDAIHVCAEKGVLIVAAAGNSTCPLIPASLPSVLAVGALDEDGLRLPSSNWNEGYRTHGLLAPGVNIPGATPGGGITVGTGTSYATALVTGVAALLLSIQIARGEEPRPAVIGRALLSSSLLSDSPGGSQGFGSLSGSLNIPGALEILAERRPAIALNTDRQKSEETKMNVSNGTHTLTEESVTPVNLSENHTEYPEVPEPISAAGEEPAAIVPAPTPEAQAMGSTGACACQKATQFVYAIGELGYEFETEARRDSFLQEMGNGGNPHDGSQMLAHLKKNPHAAADIVWTLQLDDTPVYAIQPAGPFAATVYERLRAFLNDVLKDGVERVSIPGVINGKTSLMTGQVVPNLNPTLRGMFSWATGSLVETVVSKSSPKGPDPEVQRDRIRNFLDRIYYELRNLGVTSEQRAVNFMATNAFQVGEVMSRAVSDQLELDSITTERSPVCRPGSDCWDVKLAFFNPRNRMEEARRIFRLTVDVSDVLPVSVGRMRAWAAY